MIRIRIDRNVSTAEARKIYASETQKETIASEVQKRLTEEESNKDKIIAELRAEVETLKRKLEAIINGQRLKSRDSSQIEKKSVFLQANSSCSNQNTQRMSRKDKTFVSPPSLHSDIRRTADHAMDEAIRTRSRSRKHLMEISPTDVTHKSGKRASLIADSGGTSEK